MHKSKSCILIVFLLTILTVNCAGHNNVQTSKQDTKNSEHTESINQITNKKTLAIKKYRLKAGHKVEANWTIPKDAKCADNKTATIAITISSDGNVKDIVVEKESGCNALDNSAILAIKDSTPFPPFPKETDLKETTLVIHFKSEGERRLTNKECLKIGKYRIEAKHRIHGNWIMQEKSKCNKNEIASVAFTIIPDGAIKDIIFVKKAECEELNNAALSSIKRSAPFKPFPKDIDLKKIKLGVNLNTDGVQGLTESKNLSADTYRLEVAYRVQEKWHPPNDSKCEDDAITSIVFTVISDGTIKNVFFTEESNCNGLDNSALSAINRAAPFKPFPKDLITEDYRNKIQLD